LSWIEPYNAAQGEHDIAALPWPLEQLEKKHVPKMPPGAHSQGTHREVKMLRSCNGWVPKKASLNPKAG